MELEEEPRNSWTILCIFFLSTFLSTTSTIFPGFWVHLWNSTQKAGALVCIPQAVPASRAWQNKDRESKKFNGTLPILLETHFIKGRWSFLSLWILAPSGLYCCQLWLPRWGCLRPGAEENRGKKTKEKTLYTFSEYQGFPFTLLEPELEAFLWTSFFASLASAGAWIQGGCTRGEKKMLNSLKLWWYLEFWSSLLFFLLYLLVSILSIH